MINIGDGEPWNGRHLLVHDAGMYINVFNFGYPMTKRAFNSYILQLPNGDYSIYREGPITSYAMLLYDASCISHLKVVFTSYYSTGPRRKL